MENIRLQKENQHLAQHEEEKEEGAPNTIMNAEDAEQQYASETESDNGGRDVVMVDQNQEQTPSQNPRFSHKNIMTRSRHKNRK